MFGDISSDTAVPHALRLPHTACAVQMREIKAVGELLEHCRRVSWALSSTRECLESWRNPIHIGTPTQQWQLCHLLLCDWLPVPVYLDLYEPNWILMWQEKLPNIKLKFHRDILVLVICSPRNRWMPSMLSVHMTIPNFGREHTGWKNEISHCRNLFATHTLGCVFIKTLIFLVETNPHMYQHRSVTDFDSLYKTMSKICIIFWSCHKGEEIYLKHLTDYKLEVLQYGFCATVWFP